MKPLILALLFVLLSAVNVTAAGLQIVSVRSSANPVGETIAPGQYVTRLDYSGTWVEFQTTEMFLGRNPAATFNTFGAVQVTAPVKIIQGGILVGYRRTWRATTTFSLGTARYYLVAPNGFQQSTYLSVR